MTARRAPVGSSDPCVTPIVVIYAGVAPWPFDAPIPNPPLHGYRLRPWWMWLRRGRSYNGDVREAVRSKSGVYAIREVGAARPLYVGMGGTASDRAEPSRYPARFWKTILRHLQPGTGTFRYARSTDGQPTEWLYEGNHDLEIALWLTPPEEAYQHETHLIGKLEPVHVKAGRIGPVLEDAPF